MTHLLVRDGTLELQEAVSRILEGGGIPGVGVHLLGKLPDWDLGTKVDHVAFKVSPVDLVVVDLDDGVILCVLFVSGASTEADGRGTDHVPHDAAGDSDAVLLGIVVNGVECLYRLRRVYPTLTQSRLMLHNSLFVILPLDGFNTQLSVLN